MKTATLTKITIKRKDYGRYNSTVTYFCEETNQTFYNGLLKAKRSLKAKGYSNFEMREPQTVKMNY